MHIIRCDVCKKISRQASRHGDTPEGWFSGGVKTPEDYWRFDMCEQCGPKATGTLLQILKKVSVK